MSDIRVRNIRTETKEWGGQGMRSNVLLLELPLFSHVCPFSILVLNKGNWRKFKNGIPRLRVDLACWPCSSSPELSFRAASKWAFSFSSGPVSLHEMAVLGIRAPLNDCQMSPADWQAAAAPVVCPLLEGGHNVWPDRWQILNAGSREKHFWGHFFLLTLPGSEGWECIHGNREHCSLPAVLGAPSSWEETFGALHKTAVWPVCCLLLPPWPHLPLLSYVNTCWIHLLRFLCWRLSCLLPCFSLCTSYSPCWFFAVHPFLSFLQFPL